MKQTNAHGNELVVVGRVAKAQGRRGELAVQPLSDRLGRSPQLEHLYVHLDGDVSGEAVAFAVEAVRIHKGRPVVKLAGIDDISRAEALRGKELRIPFERLEELPEGSFYHFDLRGLTVSDRSHGTLGVVEDIVSTGGTDVLVVRSDDGEESLVPFCREICVRIDPREGLIELDAPEGLVGLNAH